MNLDKFDFAEPATSPWPELRAAHPGAILVRVINVDAGAQAFVEIPRSEKALAAGGEVYDGATVIVPAPPPDCDPDYRAAIVRTFDAAWHRHHAVTSA